MYMMVDREATIRIPPDLLGENLDEVLVHLTYQQVEGKVDEDRNLVLLVTGIDRSGDGRIVHGDGGVYQDIKYEALVFKPDNKEVVVGTVCEVLKYGAFVRFGPLDGLLHISQVMDDRIDVDPTSKRLIGRDTKRELRLGDKVKARIVAVNVNERSPRESKIGLTMRQNGLGKLDWIIEARKKEEEEAKK